MRKLRKKSAASLTSRLTCKRPEDALQRAVVELLSYYENQGRLRFFAIPNGGKRPKVEAAIMKGLGVKAGIHDICILVPRRVSREGLNDFPRTIFLELKSAKGELTKEQSDYFDWQNGAGFPSYVIRSLDEAVFALQQNGVAGAITGRAA